MRLLIVGLALAGLLGGSATAAETPVDLSGVTACAIEIYSLDEDPKGLNVRAGPSASTPLVATLENSRPQNGEDYKLEMRVVGARDGWLLIDKAWFKDYGQPDTAATVFERKGWISGKLAGADVGEPVLRAGPASTAKVAATLYSPYSSSPAGQVGRFEVNRILACKGEWAEVEGAFAGKPVRGWARRLCANQTSPCR